MSNEKMSVARELEQHKSTLTPWIEHLEPLQVSAAKQGVITRFVGDCKILQGYLNQVTDPSTRDLCDFSDRLAALEIQYNIIVKDL